MASKILRNTAFLRAISSLMQHLGTHAAPTLQLCSCNSRMLPARMPLQVKLVQLYAAPAALQDAASLLPADRTQAR